MHSPHAAFPTIVPLRSTPSRSIAPLVLALGLSTSGSAASQSATPPLNDLHRTTWGIDAGVPVKGIGSLERSPDGYLWFGTATSLVRFDGVRFTVMDSTLSPALASATPGEWRTLQVDREGVLWLSRPDGALLQYRDGRFWVATTPGPDPRYIGRMAQDGAGRHWVVANRRLFRWRDGRLEPPQLPAGVPDTGIIGAVPDTGTGLWIGTFAQGLFHFTGTGAGHHHSPARPESPATRPLHQGRDGTLWVWGDRLQFLRDGVWSQLVVPDVGTVPAVEVREGPDGALWIATRGFGVVRLLGEKIEHLGEAGGLSDGVTNAILPDAEGSIWVATDAGLDQLRPATFRTLDSRDGVPFDSPLLVFGDEDGAVWAMAQGTNDTWRLDGGTIRRQPGRVRADRVRDADGRPVIPLAPARGGGMWIAGGRPGDLWLYRDGRRRRVSLPAGLWGDGPRRGVVDASGDLWVTFSPRGLGRVRGLRMERVALPEADADFLGRLAVDGRGHFWLATDQPSARLVEMAGGRVVRRFGVAEGLVEPVTRLAPEGGDTLWAVLESGNLVRVTAGVIHPVPLPNAATFLPPSTSMLLTAGGHLWFASGAGLGRLPLASLHAAADRGWGSSEVPQLFGPLDGLRLGHTTRNSAQTGFRAADGQLWFGTPAGLAVVEPSVTIVNRVPPRVHIEEIEVAGRRFPLGADSTIPANPDRLEIRFTATALRVPERVRIEYQLEGSDRSWVAAGTDRKATYTQIRPGRYTFRVRAWNEDGVPAVALATIMFRVRPAWYQTWWFATLVVLGIAGCGAGIVYRAQRLRARRAAEQLHARFEATLLERTRLARELHDTLLQDFTGLTLQLQALQRSLGNGSPAAAGTLARLLTQADTALREARQMVWDMRAPELEGHDLAEALEGAARRAVVGAPVELQFEVTGGRRSLAPAIESAVLRVGREAVINAVRHANPRRVEVALEYGAASVRLSVWDDGAGLDPAAAAVAADGGHWGLQGMRERASRAGGRLEIASPPGGGTAVSLQLPTDRDA